MANDANSDEAVVEGGILAPQRIAPILFIVALVLGGCVLVDLGFRLSDKIWPEWLPYARGGAGFTAEFDAKILVAEKQLEAGIADPALPLVVFVGQSTLRSGISAETLHRGDGIEAHYLTLGGVGGSLHFLLRNLDPILRSSLRPDLVVIGVHYFYLLPAKTNLLRENVSSNVGNPQVGISPSLRSHSWLADRRTDMTYEIDWWFSRLKVLLTHAFGLPLSRISLASTDPWADYSNETPKAYFVEEEELKAFAEKLTAAPEVYSRHQNGLGDLIQSIEDLRARNAIVALLIEPERAMVREGTPPEAHQALVGPIKDAFPGRGIEIIDFHDLLAESEFRDAGHYNAAGRERLSKALARRTSAILKDYGRLAE